MGARLIALPVYSEIAGTSPLHEHRTGGCVSTAKVENIQPRYIPEFS
jgi:hypothetical protein